jgi:hypothetical protein
MKPIEQIREILKDITDAKITDNGNLIALLTDESKGYDVTFEEKDTSYVISFGQWHEILQKNKHGAKLAVGLFKLGLSDSCRIKLYSNGEIYYKCVLEFRESKTGNWVTGEKCSRLIYSFWTKKNTNIEIFQNHIIHDVTLGDAYLKVKSDRKQTKLKISYIAVWLFLFLLLNSFDITKIISSFLLLFPVAIITLLLPIIVIDNWFKDRHFGKKKKEQLSGTEKRLLFIWISLWVSGILFSCLILGVEVFVLLSLFLLPFGLAGFFVPMWNYRQKKRNNKKG